ncbi:MAG: HAD family hydrolase [Acidimicrobiales bacterium]
MTELRIILADMDDTVLIHDVFADDLWRMVLENESSIDSSRRDAMWSAIVRERRRFWSDPERAAQGRLDMARARSMFVGSAMLEATGAVDMDLVSALVGEFSERREQSVVLEDSTRRALVSLRGAGYSLGLVTNGGADSQRSKVERFGLDALFDEVVIEGELGFGKPDRRIYEFAIERLGGDEGSSVMIGDNWEWEVEAPTSYGLNAVWIRRTGEAPPGPVPAANYLGQASDFAGAVAKFLEF